MSLGARLARTRIVSEIRFVLAGGLIGAAVGLALGLLAGLTAQRPIEVDPWVAFVATTARGIGLGWWGGLLWSTALAILARRLAPPPPVAALAPGAWVAAATVVLGVFVAHLLGQPMARGVLAGALIGSVAARLMLARAGASPQP